MVFDEMNYTALAGQIVGLIALGFCIVGFTSKHVDKSGCLSRQGVHKRVCEP